MKKISIILICALMALAACTKSKEVHPEIGDGNDEIMTVGMKDVHVEYTRTNHAELSKVVFHYCPTDANGNAQQFAAAEMTKKETFFELTLNDLFSDTLYWYYYELFPNSGDAFNSVQKTFHTQPEPPTPPTPPSNIPEGAINGLFTINENGDQVYFSQGNLQYQASTNTWRFAENQWDYVGTQYPYIGSAGGTVNGSDNTYISPTYDGWIDLFGWATSGWNNGNLYYQPYNSEIDYDNNINNSFGYGPTDGTNYNYDLTGNYANADWGIFNAIANGGNMSGNWRTLKQREWMYILFNRSTVSGKRYAKAQVNGVNGIILLPDNWITSYYNLSDTDLQNAYYNTNIISVAQWNIIENAGAIFIPAAGIRDGVLVYACGTTANYWAASIAYADQNCANVMGFGEGGFNLSGNGLDAGDFKYYGLSVRLVHDVE